MQNTLSTIKWILLIFLTLVLLTTGLGKLLDVPGFLEVLKTYQAFPNWTLPIVAIAFILAELRLAEWLITGKDKASPALASVCLHIGFTAWATVNVLRGIDVPNCGCFGVFWARPLTWSTVFEDLFMLGVSASLWQLAKRGY